MNRIVFVFALIISSLTCFKAYSAFTLNGTRFIYDEGRKNIAIEVKNNSDKPMVAKFGLIILMGMKCSLFLHLIYSK
ncbi:fimbrial chaperone [Proteus mirabilis]|nr:fimbrial chaperone [Proteus mirabilis]